MKVELVCLTYSLDNHSRSKKHLENVHQLRLEMADDDKLLAAANDETDLPEEEIVGSAEENVDVNTSRSRFRHANCNLPY